MQQQPRNPAGFPAVIESSMAPAGAITERRGFCQGSTIERQEATAEPTVPTIPKPAPRCMRKKKTITVSSAWFRAVQLQQQGGANNEIASSVGTPKEPSPNCRQVAAVSAKAYIIDGDAGWAGGPDGIEGTGEMEMQSAIVVHVALAAPEPVAACLQNSDGAGVDSAARPSVSFRAESGVGQLRDKSVASEPRNLDESKRLAQARGMQQARTATTTGRGQVTESRLEGKAPNGDPAVQGPGLVREEWQKQGLCSVFGCGMPSVSARRLFFIRSLLSLASWSPSLPAICLFRTNVVDTRIHRCNLQSILADEIR